MIASLALWYLAIRVTGYEEHTMRKTQVHINMYMRFKLGSIMRNDV